MLPTMLPSAIFTKRSFGKKNHNSLICLAVPRGLRHRNLINTLQKSGTLNPSRGSLGFLPRVSHCGLSGVKLELRTVPARLAHQREKGRRNAGGPYSSVALTKWTNSTAPLLTDNPSQTSPHRPHPGTGSGSPAPPSSRSRPCHTVSCVSLLLAVCRYRR